MMATAMRATSRAYSTAAAPFSPSVPPSLPPSAPPGPRPTTRRTKRCSPRPVGRRAENRCLFNVMVAGTAGYRPFLGKPGTGLGFVGGGRARGLLGVAPAEGLHD